jgi:hypothetical protein
LYRYQMRSHWGYTTVWWYIPTKEESSNNTSLFIRNS